MGLFVASLFVPQIKGIEILKVAVQIVFPEFAEVVNLIVFACKEKIPGSVSAKCALVDEGHVA